MSVNVWFTSDTWFGSEEKLTLLGRPFTSVQNMDDTMVSLWNDVVGDRDVVVHLGNFGNFDIASKLKGELMVLVGQNEIDEAAANHLSIYKYSDYLSDNKNVMLIYDALKPLTLLQYNDIAGKTIEYSLSMDINLSPLDDRISNRCKLQLFGGSSNNVFEHNAISVSSDLHCFKPVSGLVLSTMIDIMLHKFKINWNDNVKV